MKRLLILGLFFLFLSIQGCSIHNRFTNTFEGPDRSNEEIARLRLDAGLNVTKWVGDKAQYFVFSNGSSFGELRFLPGQHEFRVHYLSGFVQMKESMPFSFQAKAGHIYRFKCRITEMSDEEYKAKRSSTKSENGAQLLRTKIEPYIVDVTGTETWEEKPNKEFN